MGRQISESESTKQRGAPEAWHHWKNQSSRLVSFFKEQSTSNLLLMTVFHFNHFCGIVSYTLVKCESVWSFWQIFPALKIPGLNRQTMSIFDKNTSPGKFSAPAKIKDTWVLLRLFRRRIKVSIFLYHLPLSLFIHKSHIEQYFFLTCWY